MKNTLRGRPRLNIDLPAILEAVRRHGQVMSAARELRCSDSYIHVRFKRAGFTLWDVLDALDVKLLLKDAERREPWTGDANSLLRQ